MELQELTPEQIRIQEIEALTWMPWWSYLMEDFEDIIENIEKFIHDLDVPDVPTHSQKSIYIAQVNVLRTLIEKPASLLQQLRPQK